LLRLLLPLDDQVWASSRPHGHKPAASLGDLTKSSIGSSDGRCVQRAGT